MKAETSAPQHFVLDLKAAAETRLQMKQDASGGIKEAAQQFEGLLLQMMLKSMRDATAQDGPLDSEQTRFFTSIMDQQLAQNLSGTRSLGFAAMIEQQLGKGVASNAASDPASVLDVLQKSLLQQQAASSAAYGGSRVPVQAAGAVGGIGSTGGEANVSAGEFVDRIWPHALAAANAVGVPPQFVVAHSALESGWGKSEIRLPDGSPSYNLFGVKAGRSWTGPSVDVQTTEYVDGVAQSTHDKFRVYGSYAESFADYAKLLRGNERFAKVVGQQDGMQFARSLQQSGYATDPLYADKLGRIIGGATLRQALAG